MNILFITASIGYGGAAKMLTFVANQLYQRGHHVSVVNLNITAQGIEQPLHKDISIHNLDGTTGKLKKIFCIRSITKIARKEKTDVIVGFTMFPNLYACLVGKLLGIPSVMSERGDPRLTFEHSWKSKLLVSIINRCSGGVFQTGGAQEFYGKHLREKGIVIPNPIFVKGEVPNVPYGDRKKTVVSVGRLDNYQKRYDVMLKAFQLFSEKHPEYSLKLYGNGADKEKIAIWAEEMGIAGRVRFMGLTKQPMQDIAADGMFLITSDFEGISNSLLEAMAAGLPCVSTDHTPGGARLLITDHEDGLLAPVADAEKLAAAMCEYAENPALAEKCGENAKRVLQRFDPERIIDTWEAYIEEIAGN